MTLQFSKMRHRLIFQVRADDTDPSTGAITEGWAYAFERPARLVESTSGEFFDALRSNPKMTDLFELRYRAGIESAKHRVLYSPEPSAGLYQVHDIFPVRPDNERRAMMLETRFTGEMTDDIGGSPE